MSDDAGGPSTDPVWATEAETQQLRRLQTAMSEAESAVARQMGMGATDLAAMSHLAFSAASVGPGWLAGRLGLTPGAVTELVDRLERAGHLDRRRDTTDRRRVHLVPTASALDDVGETLHPLLSGLDDVARGFDGDERAVISRFLEAVIEAYDGYAAATPRRETRPN